MQQIVETDEGSCNGGDPQFPVESHQQPLPANQLFSNAGGTTGNVLNDHVAGTTGSGYFGPIITWNDISMGSLIASGSFASVYKVFINDTTITGLTTARAQLFHRGIPTSFSEMEDFDMGDNEPYALLGTMVTSSHHSYHSLTSPSSSPKPYALKKLNSIIVDTPAKINHGIKGMIFEAQLLSHILPLQEQGRSHPNIIRMIGMSPNFMNDPVNGFLILEYLVETLDNRLMRWTNRQKLMNNNDKQSNEQQQQHHQNLFSVQRLFDTHNNNNQKKCTTVREQLTRTKHVGYGIANAIQYLHENHVLYRDLKPSNVGFDARNTVKLFDFDLSRRFNCDDIDDSGAAKQLTGCIGSLRYMSPECAQGKPYGFSSDVHSFAILLWEICALQRPFEHVHTTPALVKAAFLGNERPSLRKIASPALKQLLQKCWNPNPTIRPTMPSIVETLHILFSSDDGRSKNGDSPTSLRKLMAPRKGSM